MRNCNKNLGTVYLVDCDSSFKKTFFLGGRGSVWLRKHRSRGDGREILEVTFLHLVEVIVLREIRDHSKGYMTWPKVWARHFAPT